MLSKNQNLKLLPFEIFFATPPASGLGVLNVSIPSGNNIYPNKKLKILTDTGVVLTGTLKQNNTGYWLKLDNTTPATPYTTKGTFYDSFETGINEDNVHVTFSDIKKNLYGSADIYDVNDVLLEKGSSGLVSSVAQYKLDSAKFEHSYNGNNTISITGLSLITLGIVDVHNNNIKNKKFKHAFGIAGKAFNLLCELTLTNNFTGYSNLDGSNFELKVLNYSTIERYKNIGFEIYIDRKTSATSDYVIIRGKFNTTKITDNISSDPYLSNRIYHLVSNINDVYFTETVAPGTTTNALKFSKGILGSTTTSSLMLINENIIGYTDNGVRTNKELQPELIPDNDNLNNYKNPGKYYKHNGNISTIVNKPINNNTRFLLEVLNFNFDNNNNETILMQRYVCYQQIGTTTSFQTTSFERVSTYISGTFTWSPWVEISRKGHTHVPTDIIETTAKRFVSQLDVDNWNALLAGGSGSNWKPTVSTPSQLFSSYPTPQIGWTAYVISTGSIHIFTGSTWINQKSYASDVNDGIITSQIFKDIVIGAGIDKKINLKDSYIHRLTENPETIYGANYSMINDNHIDLVKRTTPLITQLKEYTIQNGWNVNAYGSNSIMYGKDINSNTNNNIGLGLGLEFSVDNQIFLGKYNNSSNNVIFGIGNGNSNTERNNIFSVLNTGRTLAAGYSIPSGTQNDILLGNGDKLNKFDFIQSIYNDLSLAGTEIVVVPSGNETFEIVWNSTRKTNYGKFGTFEIWLKVGNNVYNKESVPVRMITELNVENQLQAVSYTLTLSGLEAIVLIK